MIHLFSAKNYFSFKDEVSIDFRVDDKASVGEGYFESPSGARISCVQAIMGPNASGKTTALRALVFLNWFITESFGYDVDEFPLLMPFAGDKSKRPAELSVVFEMEDGVYTYSVSLNSKRVIREELILNSLTQKRKTTKKVFTRIWDQKSKKYTLDGNAFNLPEEYWVSKELGNTSLISVANRFGHPYAAKLVDYWKCFGSNMDVRERFTIGGHRYAAYQALRYYEKNSSSKNRVEHDVRRYADLGIHGFEKDGMVRHGFGDDSFMLDLEHESSGTQQFLAHIKMIDEALERGGMVVIDELDAYLHPKMFNSLVGKFLNPRINKKHAQLLLSAHDLLILDALDKYQVNLAHKNRSGATSIERVASKKGVRSDDNLLAKYRQGALGSWPVVD